MFNGEGQSKPLFEPGLTVLKIIGYKLLFVASLTRIGSLSLTEKFERKL